MQGRNNDAVDVIRGLEPTSRGAVGWCATDLGCRRLWVRIPGLLCVENMADVDGGRWVFWEFSRFSAIVFRHCSIFISVHHYRRQRFRLLSAVHISLIHPRLLQGYHLPIDGVGHDVRFLFRPPDSLGDTTERVAGMQGWGKREILEKTRRPAASSGTIPTSENPGVARPGIEPLMFPQVHVQNAHFTVNNLYKNANYFVREQVVGHNVYSTATSLKTGKLLRGRNGQESAMAFLKDPPQRSPEIRMAGPAIQPVSSRMRIQDFPFTPSLHSGAAPYPPNFTPISSQDLDVKSPPNLATLTLVPRKPLMRLPPLDKGSRSHELSVFYSDCEKLTVMSHILIKIHSSLSHSVSSLPFSRLMSDSIRRSRVATHFCDLEKEAQKATPASDACAKQQQDRGSKTANSDAGQRRTDGDKTLSLGFLCPYNSLSVYQCKEFKNIIGTTVAIQLKAVHDKVLRANEVEARQLWSSTGIQGVGEMGDPRENSQTSNIVRHDSHVRKYGSSALKTSMLRAAQISSLPPAKAIGFHDGLTDFCLREANEASRRRGREQEATASSVNTAVRGEIRLSTAHLLNSTAHLQLDCPPAQFDCPPAQLDCLPAQIDCPPATRLSTCSTIAHLPNSTAHLLNSTAHLLNSTVHLSTRLPLQLLPTCSIRLSPTVDLLNDCPPAQLDCPPTQLDCPPAQLDCPPAQLDCSPAQLDYPPAQRYCPPDQLYCPSTQLDCPPAQLVCPPAQLDCPPVKRGCFAQAARRKAQRAKGTAGLSKREGEKEGEKVKRWAEKKGGGSNREGIERGRGEQAVKGNDCSADSTHTDTRLCGLGEATLYQRPSTDAEAQTRLVFPPQPTNYRVICNLRALLLCRRRNECRDGSLMHAVHYRVLPRNPLDCSPPTKANRVQSLSGSLPEFHMWESCWTMPPASKFFFSGFPVSPALSFRRCTILTSLHPHRLSRPRCYDPPKFLDSTIEQLAPSLMTTLSPTIDYSRAGIACEGIKCCGKQQQPQKTHVPLVSSACEILNSNAPGIDYESPWFDSTSVKKPRTDYSHFNNNILLRRYATLHTTLEWEPRVRCLTLYRVTDYVLPMTVTPVENTVSRKTNGIKARKSERKKKDLSGLSFRKKLSHFKARGRNILRTVKASKLQRSSKSVRAIGRRAWPGGVAGKAFTASSSSDTCESLQVRNRSRSGPASKKVNTRYKM
ncbi:hypothetical protein PR048_008188 [Dryococelus australis]|uniref:Uncharacterized protein n=1 Tax=Dryococelus australis TaxID=614101 RepID=A0ABQ9HX66_9NEOP|nr:hypothetical protein PR048_008188 [Dryococelus australis]